MKKDPSFESEKARQCLTVVKLYLTMRFVLGSPFKRNPLVLYVNTPEHSLSVLLAQENFKRKENAIYYLS